MVTPPPPFLLRDYTPADAEAVVRVALAGYGAMRDRYADWPSLAPRLLLLPDLAAHAELVVAVADEQARDARARSPRGIVGLVGYLGTHPPDRRRSGAPSEWPVIRSLVVDPAWQGIGVGRALVRECLRRARRDGAPLIALHTSPILETAVAMYERMGFAPFHRVPATASADEMTLYVKYLDGA